MKGQTVEFEIKPMGVGEILDAAIRIMTRHFGLLLGISCCLVIPLGYVSNFTTLALLPTPPQMGASQQEFMVYQQAVMQSYWKIIAVSAIAAMIVYPLMQGATIHAVSNIFLNKKTSVGASIGAAFKKMIPLLLTSILMFIIVYLGFLACLIPGFYFLVRYSLTSQVVVIEGMSGSAALKRSKELLLADRSKNYNTLVLLWLVFFAVGFGINMISQFIPDPNIQVLVSVPVQAMLTCFGSAVFAVFYFSCRCKADNFDLELLAESFKGESEDAAPAI